MDKLKDKLKTAAIVLAVDGGKVQIAAGVTADGRPGEGRRAGQLRRPAGRRQGRRQARHGDGRRHRSQHSARPGLGAGWWLSAPEPSGLGGRLPSRCASPRRVRWRRESCTALFVGRQAMGLGPKISTHARRLAAAPDAAARRGRADVLRAGQQDHLAPRPQRSRRRSPRATGRGRSARAPCPAPARPAAGCSGPRARPRRMLAHRIEQRHRGSHRPWSRAAPRGAGCRQHRHAGAQRRHHHALVDWPFPALQASAARTRAASASRGRPVVLRPPLGHLDHQRGEPVRRRGAARPARSGAGGPAGRAARRRSAPARRQRRRAAQAASASSRPV